MRANTLIQAYERMALIRAYENTVVSLAGQHRLPGTCTSIGQEASAVGVVSALSSDDLILTNHRSAGHLLARGADPARMLAEVMGKSGGYCGGKSGSLHISSKELGVVLTSTIVGGELSLVTGVALARTMLGQAGVVACFFGDGAACQGRFHESLNLAAVWKLPILYVCENNQWQAFVHRQETMLADGVVGHAAGHGIGGSRVDGMDVEAVREAAEHAISRIRETGAPHLLEVMTYRLRGHFEPDDQAYVDPAELARWRARDPLVLLRRRLIESGMADEADLDRIDVEVGVRLDRAVGVADASPYPERRELTSDVYA
ncbi:dehydrogenase [Skermanella stibiiresistens SB22]|uniref:Dehydrogenase n=1 Tax=Skermanella stibiiresistens SB22 TaxID=1385369 RepID=W9H585_9PROT|nr:thiamine pyrophosphate-dependent dehydrogenase E1 component subunit alpha [Skermanella stibiiresistens]EWY38923.1 dehydrogenase [Skermanella stibiiresistens SB22]